MYVLLIIQYKTKIIICLSIIVIIRSNMRHVVMYVPKILYMYICIYISNYILKTINTFYVFIIIIIVLKKECN